MTDFFPGGGVKKEGLKHWDLTSLCFAPSHPLKEFTVVQVSGFILSNPWYCKAEKRLWDMNSV